MVLKVRKLEDEGVEAAKPLAMQESSLLSPYWQDYITQSVSFCRPVHSYLSSYGINL